MRRAEAGRLLSCAALLGAVLALSGCSLAGYAAEAAPDEELPTALFSNYTHTVVDKGKTMLQLKAATAAAYESTSRMELSDVSFAEYDTDTGEVASLGRADRAVYHTDSKDAEFSGSVRLESKGQDAVLEGESLRWSDKDKRLEGGLETSVTISRSDGSSMSGAGFEAATRSRSFAFRDSVEGRIAESKEPAARPAEAPAAAPASAPSTAQDGGE
jgi:LPS export ABC transporter protein LptC